MNTNPHPGHNRAARYELVKPEEPAPPPPPRWNIGRRVAVAVLLAAAVVAAYTVWLRRYTQRRHARRRSAARLPFAGRFSRLAACPKEVDVPPLDETDPLVRARVAGSFLASARRRLARDERADSELYGRCHQHRGREHAGRAPARVSPGRPLQRRRTEPRRATSIRASYVRYDGVAAAVASIDAARASRIYATLKPRIEEGHRGLGSPDGTFDRSLEKAIVTFLSTPIPGRIWCASSHAGSVTPSPIPRLEGLSAAQKQLLRMEPATLASCRALFHHRSGIGHPRRTPSSGPTIAIRLVCTLPARSAQGSTTGAAGISIHAYGPVHQ